jgi:putative N6-adenine-specific DNA methylase
VDQRLFVTVKKNGVDTFHLDAPDLGLTAYSKTIKDLANKELPKAVRFIEVLYKKFLEKYPQPEGIVVTTKSDFSANFGFGSSSAVTVACTSATATSLAGAGFAALKVKDAICDQFREKVGRRPSVDVERPMVGFNLHIHRDRAVLSLDSSWNSLHKRGYRPIQTIAPLNEALAAALLLHSGWDPATPLVDPLCGSGTFCVEAAWIALNRAPGLTRDWFSFQGWIDFDRPLWNAIRDDARRAVRKELRAPIIGSDSHPGALDLARQNARAAGVGHAVSFLRRDIRAARPPEGVGPGVVICNPPYGERIGDEKEWIPLYAAIGETIAEHWPGWRLFVFTSNARLARKVGLPVRNRTPFFNGKLECQLWEFGSNRF